MSSPRLFPLLLNVLVLLLGYLLAVWQWIRHCQCFNSFTRRGAAVAEDEEKGEETAGHARRVEARGGEGKHPVIRYLSSSGAVECRRKLGEEGEEDDENRALLKSWSVRTALSRSSDEGRMLYLVPSKLG